MNSAVKPLVFQAVAICIFWDLLFKISDIEREIEENHDTDFAAHILMNQKLYRIADIIAAKQPPHSPEDDEDEDEDEASSESDFRFI